MRKFTFFLILMTMSFGFTQNLALTGSASASTEGQPASNAIDGNAATRWESAFEDPQWITIDLGASYTIGQVVLNWEGAYASTYEIQISDDATFATYTTIYATTSGDGGIDNLIVDGTGQYVRMYGTVRATPYGYSLWEFEIYEYNAATDATLSDLQVDSATISGFDPGITSYDYELPAGTTVAPTITSATATVTTGTNVTITQASSVPGNGTVVVTAADGTTTETYTVSFDVPAETTPTSAAPTPPARNTSDYISIFSDAYTNVATVNLNPNWGQSTVQSVVDIAGNNTLSYDSFNYQGTDFGGAQDISNMEYLHVDIWTNTVATNIYVISSGPEIPHAISSVDGSWQSLDIPVAGITGDLTSAIQFKFDGGDGTGIMYIDNLYFWKNPSASGTDATLSDLQVDNATISGFSSNTFNYTYELAPGTTVVPQITSATPTDANATSVTITQATDILGNATVDVVSQDGTVTETYTVTYLLSGPDAAAPTPTHDEVNNQVISIFSDAYTDLAGTNYNPDWGQSTVVTIESVMSNDALKYAGLNYQGTNLGSTDGGVSQDVSSTTHLHLDFWTANSTVIDFYVLDQGAGEVFYSLPIPAALGGDWVSVDIPLSHYTSGGEVLTDIHQFKVTGDGTVYFDNIYFYNETALSVGDFEVEEFKVYPNPTNSVWNITSSTQINIVEVFNVMGKKIITIQPNANETSIDATSLNSGIYFVKIDAATGLKTIKLIKE
ncbi:galactose-binding domain-containing protein [Winogradskyella endarachnes]|uniref:galactose-binding domain-containing protein n=1 Tax=Winogradskyella endarachnes TaxID=2681965 RepID=UPI0018D2311A|nr:discoidin domain-containing protein [Winogradskyella endarachnes]